MGRLTKKLSFLDKYGGKSEATPPLNIGTEKECLYAYNVHFDVKEGKAAIIKRKGYTKINAIATSAKIVHISQFSIGTTGYLSCVDDSANIYSVDLNAGTVTNNKTLTALAGSKWSSATLSGKHFLTNSTDGLYYTLDNVTWTVTAMGELSILKRFKDYLMGAGTTSNPNIVYWSDLGNGADWTTALNYNSLDQGDEDKITGMEVIGEQLIIFKQHMLWRVFATDSATLGAQFRFIPVYGGIGAESQDAIKRIQIDNVDYLYFIGDRGIFIIGVSGNPIEITDKVQSTYNEMVKSKLNNCLIVENPRDHTVYLAYTEGSKVTPTRELVLSLRCKAWSQYNIAMSSVITYYGTSDNYIIFGDKNGYLYKHDWRNTEQLTDYSDNGVAIESFWQSNYIDYGKPIEYKQIKSSTIRIRETSGDCPIIVSKVNEEQTVVSETVSSLGAGVGARYGTAIFGTDYFAPECGYLEQHVGFRLYGMEISTRYENNTKDQSMIVYGWIDELKFSNNMKGA
jgi:hypothetical protein